MGPVTLLSSDKIFDFPEEVHVKDIKKADAPPPPPNYTELNDWFL